MVGAMTEPERPLTPSENARWRRWRSRFYLWLLIAGMVAIAVAGWINVQRIRHAVQP